MCFWSFCGVLLTLSYLCQFFYHFEDFKCTVFFFLGVFVILMIAMVFVRFLTFLGSLFSLESSVIE